MLINFYVHLFTLTFCPVLLQEGVRTSRVGYRRAVAGLLHGREVVPASDPQEEHQEVREHYLLFICIFRGFFRMCSEYEIDNTVVFIPMIA
jgi:hypothetical protein